jgi:hypothetical protein
VGDRLGRWVALLAAVGVTACGDDGDGARTAEERADRPVVPPPGWRSLANERAGFTIPVPRSWTARTKAGATLIRSPDRFAVVTVAVDRGHAGRVTPPRRYARRTIAALPGFEGTLEPRTGRVRGSPYRNARADASGSLRTSRAPQRISVVAFQRPGRVTYAVLAFRNARVARPRSERVIGRMLRGLRGRPPRR